MGAEVIGGEGGRWSTWVELLLAAAILRYGTRNWNLVAAELRARTVCPYTFTPEVCKAKYNDLRKRYSGCKAWFEALRKKRMEELKQALKRSEDSIGSLESKLESLKAKKGGEDGCNNYRPSQTESPVNYQKPRGNYPRVKDAFKDHEASAGSFTCEEALASCSPECQKPAEETRTKIEEASHSSEHEKLSSIEKLVGTLYVGVGGLGGATLRKRRGKRKRKDCSSKDVKESSIGESGLLDSPNTAVTALPCVENNSATASECHEEFGSSGAGDCNGGLWEVFNSIMEHKSASVFRHRLDSQKRRRYKKLILRHIDFDTIGSRIYNHSVLSVKELFRDLLLLTNNALVFYSKCTREYKSALLLRDLTTKTLGLHCKDCTSKQANSANLSSNALAMCNPPVKPRSARPAGNRKLAGRGTNVAAKTSNRGNKASHVNADSSPSVESFAVTKKASGQPRKAGRRSGSQQNVSPPMKGRKRSRTR